MGPIIPYALNVNIDVTRFSSKEEADILGSKPVNEVGEMRPTSLRLRTEKSIVRIRTKAGSNTFGS